MHIELTRGLVSRLNKLTSLSTKTLNQLERPLPGLEIYAAVVQTPDEFQLMKFVRPRDERRYNLLMAIKARHPRAQLRLSSAAFFTNSDDKIYCTTQMKYSGPNQRP